MLDHAQVRREELRLDVAGFIAESIANPNMYVAKGFSPGVMPSTYKAKLGDKNIAALAEYLAKGGSGS